MNIVFSTKKIIAIIILLTLSALLIVTSKFYIAPKIREARNAYSVVYLKTGEVYIGQLKTWPKMELNNAFLFQTIADPEDPTKSKTQLTPLKESLWAPKKLYLNKENVVFYGELEETSKIAQAILGKGNKEGGKDVEVKDKSSNEATKNANKETTDTKGKSAK